jgi:hypothetical protein
MRQVSAFVLLSGLLMIADLNAGRVAPQNVSHDFSGNFGHEFSYDPNAIVWKISPSGKGYVIQLDKTNEKFVARRLTRKEQRAFWHRMQWPEDKTNKIACIGYAKADADPATICHLDQAAQRATRWIESDYFYHDKILGVFKIKRQGQQQQTNGQ